MGSIPALLFGAIGAGGFIGEIVEGKIEPGLLLFVD